MSKVVEFPQALQAIKPEMRQVGERPIYSLSDLSEGALDTTKSQGLGEALETSSVQALWQPLQDWSNQELASLYRAHRLLNLTGISFDVDRGLSDESEPWFVFLDEADQVFAHFCRIDGRYYLDSAAQDGCIMAPSLEALVESFARRNEMLKGAAPQQSASSQVIAFNSPVRTKVLMHPGVSLAALIWSVYMLSDGLILPLWKQGVDGYEGGFDGPAVRPVDLEQSFLLPETSLDFPLIEKAENRADPSVSLQTSDVREAHNATHNSIFGPGGIYALNVVGFGLTAMSVSYGIYKFALPTSLLYPVNEMLETALGAKSAEALGGSGTDLTGFLESLSEAINVLSSSYIQTQDADDVAAAVTVKAQKLLDGLKTAILSLEPTDQIVDHTVKLKKIDASPPLEATAKIMPAVEQTVVDAVEKSAENIRYFALSEQDFFHKIFESDVIELAKLGELASVFSSEIPYLTEGVSSGEQEGKTVLASGQGFSAVENYALFDQTAHDFVIHLLTKDQGSQRSTYNEEVVIIDISAFDGTGGDVYARSWFFEDGSVLSTVGLKSDFEAFGLIV